MIMMKMGKDITRTYSRLVGRGAARSGTFWTERGGEGGGGAVPNPPINPLAIEKVMAFDRVTRQALPQTAVTHLHLLRHGAVDTGGRRRAYGITDAPLSAEGLRQATALIDFAADASFTVLLEGDAVASPPHLVVGRLPTDLRTGASRRHRLPLVSHLSPLRV